MTSQPKDPTPTSVPTPPAPRIDSNDMRASLAAELAVGVLPVADILTQFGLTPGQLKLMLQDKQFYSMVVQYRRDWEAASNAKERIQLKSAVMVEENLIELHRLFNDIELNPSARLDAFKEMVKLSDTAPRKDAPDTGPKFHLTINLGGDSEETLVIDADSTATATASASASIETLEEYPLA